MVPVPFSAAAASSSPTASGIPLTTATALLPVAGYTPPAASDRLSAALHNKFTHAHIGNYPTQVLYRIKEAVIASLIRLR